MGLLDVVFPPRCAGCDALMPPGAAFCEECLPTLIPLPSPACRRCALPLLGEAALELCPRCLSDPPAFDRAAAPFAFAGAVAEAIPRFKYRDRPELAPTLADLGWAAYADALAGVELIVPVPLHVCRLRERGYDQAWLLARHLSRRSRIPAEPRTIRRLRATTAQVGGSARERADNLRGAFRAERRLDGLVVAVVDDVVTTTTTVREVARAARDAGAREVRVLALARAF